MLQSRFAAKIAVISAVLSLGMSSIAIAGTDTSAPPDPIAGPCGPYPTTCLPDDPTPSPDPCFDNPDPIYFETNCVDPNAPGPGPGPGPGEKPDGEDPQDWTSAPDDCGPTYAEVCDASTRPRPVLRFGRPR